MCVIKKKVIYTAENVFAATNVMELKLWPCM